MQSIIAIACLPFMQKNTEQNATKLRAYEEWRGGDRKIVCRSVCARACVCVCACACACTVCVSSRYACCQRFMQGLRIYMHEWENAPEVRRLQYS